MSRTTNVMVGFLAGAAAGMLAGVLLAPDKGSGTRKKIKNKMQDVTGNIAATISDQIDFLEDQIKSLRKNAEREGKKIKSAAVNAEEKIKSGPEPLT
ncbi:MAG: YtxH domain-containing protein [Prolixibacteraceae bacterium]